MKVIRILVGIIIVYGCMPWACVCVVPNQLLKVYHHRVEVDRDAVPFIELGKIVFSFASEPKIDLIAQEELKSGQIKRTFLFPATEVANDECSQMLQAISLNRRNSFYNVSFEVVDKPEKGIRFIVAYDRDKVGMTYAVLESQGAQKRLIVTFYDKNQIRRIKSAQESVLRTAHAVRKPGVIVDIGHGGSDSGAQGCCDLVEKDVNLEVGTYVANLLRKKGFDVFLTRSTDIAIALDERTMMTAQNKSAAVFVSIHSNAAPNKQAAGIETFFFDIARYCKGEDKPSRLVAALLHERCAKSKLLAECIHKSVLTHAKHVQPAVVDRAVKESFLQVLVGTSVPSALVELGFLTNSQEASLMHDSHYKMVLAAGICEGITQYFKNE